MNSKVIALTLFTVTAATVAFFPMYKGIGATTTTKLTLPPINPLSNEQPRVEVAFVLDTTGSMGA